MEPSVDNDELKQTIGRLVEANTQRRDSFVVAPVVKIDSARDRSAQPTAVHLGRAGSMRVLRYSKLEAESIACVAKHRTRRNRHGIQR